MAPRKSTCGPLVRHSYVYRAAAALPFTAQAQESVRRVAVLTSTTPDEPGSQALQSGTSLNSSTCGLSWAVLRLASLDKIVNRPRATMWWLDLAYAPHLRQKAGGVCSPLMRRGVFSVSFALWAKRGVP